MVSRIKVPVPIPKEKQNSSINEFHWTLKYFRVYLPKAAKNKIIRVREATFRMISKR